jgi:hypothetical protein
MRPFKRLFIVLVVGAVMGWLAMPAEAHTKSARGTDGCLLLHHNDDYGGLDAASGTCTGQDNYWAAHLADDHATSDGYCVKAVLDGVLMAYSCDSAGINFTFHDPQLNSNANTCLDKGSAGQFADVCAPNTGF